MYPTLIRQNFAFMPLFTIPYLGLREKLPSVFLPLYIIHHHVTRLIPAPALETPLRSTAPDFTPYSRSMRMSCSVQATASFSCAIDNAQNDFDLVPRDVRLPVGYKTANTDPASFQI